MKQDWKSADPVLNLTLMFVSALLWLTFGLLTQAIAPLTEYEQGIDLVYLPAGVRLGIVLVFGFWGAVGIVIANPFLFYLEFGEHNVLELAINSLICGFVPYFTVEVVKRMLNVDGRLEKFKPQHLPVFALAVSAVTPLAFNINFIVFHYKPEAQIMGNFSAMMLGDFFGCLVVLIIMRASVFLYRRIV